MDELLTWADVADRLENAPRGTAYKLAAALSMNTSYFYRKVNGRKGQLTAQQARAATAFFAMPGLDPVEPAPFAPAQGDKVIRLPVYGYAAASDGDRITLGEGEILEWLELPHGLLLGPGDYFVVKPIGSSMEPRVFPGEPLVVRRKYPPARDKEVIIEFNDGSGLIKTYQGQRDGRVFVKQWNEEKLLDFDASTVKALHAVAFKL